MRYPVAGLLFLAVTCAPTRGDAVKAGPERQHLRVARMRLEVVHSAIEFRPKLIAVRAVPPDRARKARNGEECVALLECSAGDCDVKAVLPAGARVAGGTLHVGCTLHGDAIVIPHPFPLALGWRDAEAVRYDPASTLYVGATYHADPQDELHFVNYVILERKPGEPRRWK